MNSVVLVEKKTPNPVDPTKCSHARINRVFDSWFCNRCGAEFKPVNFKHRTKWSDEYAR